MGIEFSSNGRPASWGRPSSWGRPASWLCDISGQAPPQPEEQCECCQQIKQGYDHVGGLGMGGDGLSSRRELVELLDSEPVFGYLLQNGVLEPDHVDEIKKEASPAKVNVALLRHVEGGGVAGAQQLLVNALRQSGQLHLANLLDDSRRITALSASGYLGKSRRKGQVQLQVKVKALRLPRDNLPVSLNPPATPAKPPAPPREWVSLDDIHLRILALTAPPPASSSSVPTTTTSATKTTSSSLDITKKRKHLCLCACFASLFNRNRKNQSNKNNVSLNESLKSTTVHYNQRNSFTTVVSSSTPAINKLQPTADKYTIKPGHSSPHLSGSGSHAQLENLRHMADLMTQKAVLFNELVQDAATQSHVALLKYFEQERGTLVLESSSDEHLAVVTICMKVSQVQAYRRDMGSSSIMEDVEALIDSEELFERTGASGVKLEISADDEELDIAEMELTSPA